MKALVTGASGFIGGAIARALLDEGVEVRALLREGSTPNVETGAVEVVRGDLRDRRAVREAMRGCEAVYHAGALYQLDGPPDLMHAINVDGTRHVLESALEEGVSRVVHTSSISTLVADGHAAPGPYKQSKRDAERLALDFARRGLDVVIVNPTFPVGAGDVKPTPTGKVLVDFLNGRLPAYVDTGMNVVDVDDVAQGHLLAFARGRRGERYVLGHRNLTMRELLEETARLVGRTPPRFRLPHRAVLALALADRFVERRLLGRRPTIPLEGVRMSARPMFADPSAAVRELGLPQTPVRDALLEAITWFEAHGHIRPRRVSAPLRRNEVPA